MVDLSVCSALSNHHTLRAMRSILSRTHERCVILCRGLGQVMILEVPTSQQTGFGWKPLVQDREASAPISCSSLHHQRSQTLDMSLQCNSLERCNDSIYRRSRPRHHRCELSRYGRMERGSQIFDKQYPAVEISSSGPFQGATAAAIQRV